VRWRHPWQHQVANGNSRPLQAREEASERETLDRSSIDLPVLAQIELLVVMAAARNPGNDLVALINDKTAASKFGCAAVRCPIPSRRSLDLLRLRSFVQVLGVILVLSFCSCFIFSSGSWYLNYKLCMYDG